MSLTLQRIPSTTEWLFAKIVVPLLVFPVWPAITVLVSLWLAEQGPRGPRAAIILGVLWGLGELSLIALAFAWRLKLKRWATPSP